MYCEYSNMTTSTLSSISIPATSFPTVSVSTRTTTKLVQTTLTAFKAIPCPSNIANICQNNASCMVSSNGYFCSCVNGFTGIFCNILPNSQIVTTMTTTTTTSSSALTDTTTTGVLFQNCPLSVSKICQNNSTCVYSNQTNNSKCLCRPGYSGTFCQSQNSSYCSPNSCKNGGFCVEDLEKPINGACTCPQNYAGKFKTYLSSIRTLK